MCIIVEFQSECEGSSLIVFSILGKPLKKGQKWAGDEFWINPSLSLSVNVMQIENKLESAHERRLF